MKDLESLAISQWNLCLAAVWTVIQILQIICKVVTKSVQTCTWEDMIFGFFEAWKMFMAPTEELGKFTNSVTVIA